MFSDIVELLLSGEKNNLKGGILWLILSMMKEKKIC
jgi:hypothetical protein